MLIRDRSGNCVLARSASSGADVEVSHTQGKSTTQGETDDETGEADEELTVLADGRKERAAFCIPLREE
jgi:hypothetical protein